MVVPPMRVLYVEDNEDDAVLFRELLGRVTAPPFEVEHTNRLATSLARLERAPPDALLLDLSLPDSQGLDTLIAVRARAADIPIIVLTGCRDEKLADQLIRHGAQGYLVKREATSDILARAIRHGIERTRQLRSLEEDRNRVLRHARLDPLTGLPNAVCFFDRLPKAVSQAAGRDGRFALLLINLDEFKQANELAGHSGGDRVLRTVAARLQAHLPSRIFLARLDADAFAVLMENLDHPGEIAELADALLDALAAPIAVNGSEIVITASMGIAFYPQDGSDSESLFDAADAAMRSVKSDGGHDYGFFSHSRRCPVIGRLDLQAALKEAHEQQAFSLHFQPVVKFADLDAIELEARVRWMHRDFGWLDVDRFSHAAFEGDVLSRVWDWSLARTAEQVAVWLDRYGKQVAIRFGVYHCCLRDRRLPDKVEQMALDAGQPAPRFTMQVPALALAAPSLVVEESLRSVRELGFHLCASGFSADLAGLERLAKVGVDSIKLGARFARGLEESVTDQAMVAGIAAAAEHLDWPVAADGVDAQRQATLLHSLGCTYGQGNYFAPPLTPACLENLPIAFGVT